MEQYTLKNDEKAIFGLRSLYSKYGYSQYKMSKFEEYDLYVRNKDFLISDNIITFTDTNGKLLALKPDVTLSIIKNSKDVPNTVNKVYYNENVYRVSSGTHSFKEIMQVGIECLGDIDDYCIYEVVMLAGKSLLSMSDECVLEVSHLGIVFDMIESLGLSDDAKKKIIKAIGEKNAHEISSICTDENVSSEKIESLQKLVNLYGKPEDILPILKTISDSTGVAKLENLTNTLSCDDYYDKVRLDFSLVSDFNYYNGIVFKGYINGIPTSILSGGQYDKLMKRMNRKSGAIGFAVYLDMLERLDVNDNKYDVDTVILYDNETDLSALNNAIKLLTDNGKSVMAQKAVPEKIKYKQLLKMQDRGVEIIETDA